MLSISVTFWGTRGTIPTPGARTARYGGNTSCVVVGDAQGRQVILDAGTGIRALGQSLRGAAPSTVELFLSHVHWDHIQGLPFFAPTFCEGQAIRIRGPAPDGVSLAEVLERQLQPAVYPVPRAARTAELTVEEIAAGSAHDAPGFTVETCVLSHPGGALGYRLTPSGGGPSVAYLTDNELGKGGTALVPRRWREQTVRFLSGASLLIHDGMYTAEVGEARPGWGHSSALEAVALARDAGLDQLVLFHHDPDHDDAQVDALLAVATAAAPPGMTVAAAREGTTVTL